MYQDSTWSNPDGSVKKEIVSLGHWNHTPREGAKCLIEIEDVSCEGVELKEIKGNKELCVTFNDDFNGVFIIGECDTEIDRTVEKCLLTMLPKEHSAVELLIKPRTFADEDLKTETIVIKCKILLKEIENRAAIFDWSESEKLDSVLHHKQKGVELFQSGRIVDAFNRFSKAYKVLLSMESVDIAVEFKGRISLLRINICNNLSSCQLRRNNYDFVVDLCCKILELDKNNVKALYKRAVAYIELQEYEKAEGDLNHLFELEPNNQAAKTQQRILHAKMQELNQKYATAMKKMFSQ